MNEFAMFHRRAWKEITYLKAEIKRKEMLIEEALNQLYVDSDGMGSIREAVSFLHQALNEVKE